MRKIQMLSISVFIILFFSCSESSSSENSEVKNDSSKEESVQHLSETEQAFFDNLKSLCGKSFSGKETYVQEGRESWTGKHLVMHLRVCEEDQVHIPFHIDDDESRTWMFLAKDGKLRFRHDHRHPDGTPEDETLYGGYSDGNGTAFMQSFPADEYTIELLSDTLNRQWTVKLSEDLSVFSYRLLYHGEVVFQADFDLSENLNQ